MAFSKIALTGSTWTLIGNNLNPITFQNVGQQPLYITVTSTNTTPTDTFGLTYDSYMGEVLVNPTTLAKSGGTYVWAKAISGVTSVIVE